MEISKKIILNKILNSNLVTERIKVSKNFFLDEFIDPFTYLNSKDRGLNSIDIRIIKISQELRNDYNSSLIINTWWNYFIKHECNEPYDKIINFIENSKNMFKWSGYRPAHCNIGAKKSAHKVGKAADPKGNPVTLFNIIEKNPKKYYDLGLRRLEDIKITPTWLHFDTLERNTSKNSIRVVNLKVSTKTIKW